MPSTGLDELSVVSFPKSVWIEGVQESVRCSETMDKEDDEALWGEATIIQHSLNV